MSDIKNELFRMTKESAVNKLKQKYQNIIDRITSDTGSSGVYIWGTGRLGRFAYDQCIKNNVLVYGYIDNNKNKLNAEKKIFSCDILKSDDVVIISSFYCVDIAEQLKKLGVANHIYYEELALILDGFDVYYQAFMGIFEELESNKSEYIRLYDILEDDLSREIFTDIINYRMSLDTKYTSDALNLSLQRGSQYFDKVITESVDKNFTFFDVGAFDGESTLDFIKNIGGYRKIYFFEPDKKIIESAEKRLECRKNIEFIQAGVSEKASEVYYDAIGGGAGNITDQGTERIKTVALNDYISSHRVYIKLDIEGHEIYALRGMKEAIVRYKPMLAVSVYHQCGDMHKLVDAILSWNPGYKVYMRHYTYTYADTVCYFIDNAFDKK